MHPISTQEDALAANRRAQEAAGGGQPAARAQRRTRMVSTVAPHEPTGTHRQQHPAQVPFLLFMPMQVNSWVVTYAFVILSLSEHNGFC